MDNELQITWPRATANIFYNNLTLQHAGRTNKFTVPFDIWEPFIEWISKVRWSCKGLGPAADATTSAQRRMTWIEIVIAFQIQTGIRMTKIRMGLSYAGESYQVHFEESS